LAIDKLFISVIMCNKNDARLKSGQSTVLPYLKWMDDSLPQQGQSSQQAALMGFGGVPCKHHHPLSKLRFL
ncbi:MAG: hypothetical protein R3346_03495, partial [Candidatus Spechtbacterales bacterium]|nr:hypothetical protein [Candidatus Spechtbacterales bacterium]